MGQLNCCMQDRRVAPQPKQGLFKRIFGRGKRGGEHESFSSFAQYAPTDRVPDDAAPNIVILNSLTHDQLMELLKVILVLDMLNNICCLLHTWAASCANMSTATFAECVVNMLQAHQQPEAKLRGQMHTANVASLTTRGPGLPRFPLSQASLNTPQAFASSSGSPAPSTASTNTGATTIACHDCLLIVGNSSAIMLVALTLQCTILPTVKCDSLSCVFDFMSMTERTKGTNNIYASEMTSCHCHD